MGSCESKPLLRTSLACALVCMLPFGLAFHSIVPLIKLVRDNQTFSQIPLIPFVSLFFVYEKRKQIFSAPPAGRLFALAMIVPGLVLLELARVNLFHLTSTNPESLLLFAAVLIWWGAFALFFGASAFLAALFPLGFLLFMVPIPEPALSKIVYFLQAGSSDMAQAFFGVLGIPYHREGFVFDLPGVAIRVAEECSGIRSTLALVITTVVASYIFLKSSWKRVLLCAAIVPVAIFKNGLRIATLSALSIYVDPDFLYGDLHHRGGIVFFIIALLPMIGLLGLLQRRENKGSATIGAV